MVHPLDRWWGCQHAFYGLDKGYLRWSSLHWVRWCLRCFLESYRIVKTFQENGNRLENSRSKIQLAYSRLWVWLSRLSLGIKGWIVQRLDRTKKRLCVEILNVFWLASRLFKKPWGCFFPKAHQKNQSLKLRMLWVTQTSLHVNTELCVRHHIIFKKNVIRLLADSFRSTKTLSSY